MRPLIDRELGVTLRDSEWKSIEIEIKYEGYLEQQKRSIERMRRAENRKIPRGFLYDGLPGLSNEIVEKMERVRPATLGQAGRIPGVTPAALSIVNLHLDSERSSLA